MRLFIFVFVFALMMMATSFGTAQAATNLGTGGMSFSCDVNTQKCQCSGVESGADCQAMKKNCRPDVALNCFKDIHYNDICICNMAMRHKKPGINAPKGTTLAPQ